MKKTRTFLQLIIFSLLISCLGISIPNGAFAGNQKFIGSTTKPRVSVDVNIPRIKLCADLRVWGNFNLSPHDEFPFSTQCASCWRQVGILNLPDMALWVENGGNLDMPATVAKMTWFSGKPPYNKKSIQVTIPALKVGERKFITIHVPANSFFQLAKPISIELDSGHAVRECNENNNISTWRYR